MIINPLVIIAKAPWYPDKLSPEKQALFTFALDDKISFTWGSRAFPLYKSLLYIKPHFMPTFSVQCLLMWLQLMSPWRHLLWECPRDKLKVNSGSWLFLKRPGLEASVHETHITMLPITPHSNGHTCLFFRTWLRCHLPLQCPCSGVHRHPSASLSHRTGCHRWSPFTHPPQH